MTSLKSQPEDLVIGTETGIPMWGSIAHVGDFVYHPYHGKCRVEEVRLGTYSMMRISYGKNFNDGEMWCFGAELSWNPWPEIEWKKKKSDDKEVEDGIVGKRV